MKRTLFGLLALVALCGCNRQGQKSSGSPTPGRQSDGGSLVDARKGFKTKVTRVDKGHGPAPAPPPNLFQLIRFDAPVGKLAAYLSPDPGDGKKHPAIIWITGGDCNSIDDGCWNEGPPVNEQSASAYRKAGIVMMFPSLRGGNNNPGAKESFLGEVDDVLAAADFLAKQKFVDPDRIYLGGHSTGGTMALLVAECSDRFRAVFSFGPVHDVSGYDPQYLTFDRSNPREVELRSPGHWLSSVKSPTFVLEGMVQGNIGALQEMSRASTNPQLHFLPIPGANHFSLLGPANRVIAAKILRDTGTTTNLTLTAADIPPR
jgi:acetyl esterase/lipase